MKSPRVGNSKGGWQGGYGILAFRIALGLAVLLSVACRQDGQDLEGIPSPDGRFRLVVHIQDGTVVFTINDAANAVLHVQDTRASHYQRWKVGWDDDGRVWLNSSDIGTYVWEEQADGSWKEVGKPGPMPDSMKY